MLHYCKVFKCSKHNLHPQGFHDISLPLLLLHLLDLHFASSSFTSATPSSLPFSSSFFSNSVIFCIISGSTPIMMMECSHKRRLEYQHTMAYTSRIDTMGTLRKYLMMVRLMYLPIDGILNDTKLSTKTPG